MNSFLRYAVFLGLSLAAYADFQWKGTEYHTNSSSQQQAALDMLKELSFKGNESILDVGCGDGKVTCTLSNLVPEGTVVGIDLSSSQIAYAQKFSSERRWFLEGDIQELPYVHSFDFVTAFTVMQWIPDQVKAFEKIYCALKENGMLVISVPTGITWQLAEAVREVISREQWNQYRFQDKQFFFSREEYACNLRKAGFAIKKLTIEPSFNLFENKSMFTAFVKQWLPFVQDVPLDLQDEFMTQIIDVYQNLMPSRMDSQVFFEKYVYHILAKKES